MANNTVSSRTPPWPTGASSWEMATHAALFGEAVSWSPDLGDTPFLTGTLTCLGVATGRATVVSVEITEGTSGGGQFDSPFRPLVRCLLRAVTPDGDPLGDVVVGIDGKFLIPAWLDPAVCIIFGTILEG